MPTLSQLSEMTEIERNMSWPFINSRSLKHSVLTGAYQRQSHEGACNSDSIQILISIVRSMAKEMQCTITLQQPTCSLQPTGFTELASLLTDNKRASPY